MATDQTKFRILSFQLPHDAVVRLDRLAEKGGLSRSQLLVNFVMAGIDFLEGCEGWGVFSVRKVFDNMKSVLSKRMKFKVA
jgi:hypothetical protein